MGRWKGKKRGNVGKDSIDKCWRGGAGEVTGHLGNTNMSNGVMLNGRGGLM